MSTEHWLHKKVWNAEARKYNLLTTLCNAQPQPMILEVNPGSAYGGTRIKGASNSIDRLNCPDCARIYIAQQEAKLAKLKQRVGIC